MMGELCHMSSFFFLAAAIILFSDVLYLWYKKSLSSIGIKVVFDIVVGFIAVIAYLFPQLPQEVKYIIAVCAAIIILGIAFWSRISKRVTLRLPIILKKGDNKNVAQPSSKSKTQIISALALKYGKPIVRKSSDHGHGGIYYTSMYFVEVVNTTLNTVAKNCKGSITVSATELNNQATVWEKNNDYSIDIGYKEFLYLFKVSIFTDKTGKEETRLYLSHPSDIDLVDEVAKRSFYGNLDKKLTALVQSDNASFPSEAESFNKTIHQIMHEAVEE